MPSKAKNSKPKPQPQPSEQEFWNVVEIVDEDEEKRKYKVVWEGINPITGKPWPMDWVPYSDCTPELKADWKKKKKARGAPAAKKPLKRAASATSRTQSKGPGSVASSMNSSLRSTASTESTRKRRANKLTAPVTEEATETRPNKRRKLAEPEYTQPPTRPESSETLHVASQPSPKRTSVRSNKSDQARAKSASDDEESLQLPVRRTKKRTKSVVVETQPSQDVISVATSSKSPAPTEPELELKPVPAPPRFGPPKSTKPESPTASPPKLSSKTPSPSIKYGPPRHSKSISPKEQRIKAALPSSPVAVVTAVEIPSPTLTQNKRKARPNPWSDPEVDGLEVSEAELAPSPPRKRRLPRKPSPLFKSLSRSGSVKSAGSSSKVAVAGEDTPMTQRLHQWEEDVGFSHEEVPEVLPKSTLNNGVLPSIVRLQRVAEDESIVPDSDVEESAPDRNEPSASRISPDAPDFSPYRRSPPLTDTNNFEETTEYEVIQEATSSQLQQAESVVQSITPSPPPSSRVLKPVPYVSPSAFKPYLSSSPVTQDLNIGHMEDPISQFSSPTKSQAQRAQEQDQIENSFDGGRPEPDTTIDDSNELSRLPEPHREEEEESSQDILAEMEKRQATGDAVQVLVVEMEEGEAAREDEQDHLVEVKQVEEEEARNLSAVEEEEAALSQNLLSIEGDEDEEEGEQIYFPPDVIHSFEAGYIPPLEDDNELVSEPIIEAGGEEGEFELMGPEEPDQVQTFFTINPALLEPNQAEPLQFLPERSPSSSPAQPEQPILPEIPRPLPDTSTEQDLISQLKATIAQLQSDLARETARTKFAQSEEASIRHAYISVSQNHTDIVRELNFVRAQLSQLQLDAERAEKRATEGVQGVKLFYADIISKLKQDVEKLQSELVFVREKERRTESDAIRKKASMHDEIQMKLKEQISISSELAFGKRQTELKLDELQASFEKLQTNCNQLQSEKEAIESEKERVQGENAGLRVAVEKLQLKVGEKYYWVCEHVDGCDKRFKTYEELESHWNAHLAEDFPEHNVPELSDTSF